MKRLVSVHLYESKSDVCSKCGMDYEAGNDCCRNELKVIKLDQDQSNLVYTSPGILKLSVPVSVLSTFLVSPVFTITVSPHFYNHSPPLLSASDTYLVNKVFRI
jgi:hypothetical protein